MSTEAAMGTERESARAALLASYYRPLPGVVDEMVDAAGNIRPHWHGLVDRLAAIGPDGLAQRFATADRHLRESGVFYRVYADPTARERAWPLAHVPLVISAGEWAEIERGVIQRARLIEAVLSDAYRGGDAIARAGLPATLVAGSPDFLRPLVAQGRAPARQLHLYAVDLVRGANGAWSVLRDRTQAPSGAGYAIENRIALTRALPDVFADLDIARLAPFFDALRAELARHDAPNGAGVCLMTPGPLNETYFEHAYLARYLGVRLVEGVDLIVHRAAVYLRTVAGLDRVHVLLRRIDGDFADPLELNARSELGVPGLAQAVRMGNVTVANALGSGLTEARALLAALPRLAGPLLGEELSLPQVTTTWCGDAQGREAVLDQLDNLFIAPAFSRLGRVVPSGGPWLPGSLSVDERNALVEAIRRRGVDFVGQDVAQLSTMPVWTGNRLAPHPVTFRVFVTASEDGYKVMPGGFARIGDAYGLDSVSMQRGARAADVWVEAEGPVAPVSLIPSESDIVVRRQAGVLASRAADNLYWLSRYLERAEATLRLVRALAVRIAEPHAETRADVEAIIGLLFRWGATDVPAQAGEAMRAAEMALTSTEMEGAVPRLVAAARRAGSVIRDRLPPDAWRALDDLNASLSSPAAADAGEGESPAVFDRAGAALRTIAAVAGYQLDGMNRHAGWRFLKIGLRIERALAVARFARQLAYGDATRESLELLLELNDCQITYRSRYPFGAAPAPVIDLVVLDESNPRSLAYQLTRIRTHAHALPLPTTGERASPALAISDRLRNVVRDWQPETIQADDLLGIENSLMHLSDEISQSFFKLHDPFAASGGAR